MCSRQIAPDRHLCSHRLVSGSSAAMASPRYRHVIWDWNGTLLDDVDLCIELMNGLLKPRGLATLDRARHHETFGFPVRDYYRRLGFDEGRDPFERLGAEFISGYDQRRWECRLYQGAETLLAAIVAAGMTQSILSAYRQETLREIVQHFGLDRYFVRLTGLDNIYAHSKTELGRAWVQELGLPKESVVLVGDTLHDWDVAQALGVACILVDCGHHSPAQLRTRGSHVVSDLAGVAAALGVVPAAESLSDP